MPFNSYQAVKVHKHLLGPEEKARMIASMSAKVGEGQYNAFIWSRIFKRLPATILKIAAEAGIKLRP